MTPSPAKRAPRARPVPDAADTLVAVDNRQRTRPVRAAALRDLALAVLGRLGRTAELGVHLVPAREMARVNWDFLRHEGSTDVITFDHGSTARHLHGELFVSVADAVRQADEFGTRWDAEVARYVVHGILHLCGHDDLRPDLRRAMKREENRLMRWLRDSGRLDGLATPAGPARRSRPRRHG